MSAITNKRDHAINGAVILVTNLLRCVIWLIRHGVFIQGFRGDKSSAGTDRATIVVSASPFLYELFRKECFWLKRMQRGNISVFIWQATRWGITIEWEESCAFPNC